MNLPKYGFIITRHVNSVKTNKYWNLCIRSIRRFYSPEKYKIVVIDDNSNKDFLKQNVEYQNVIYIQSEFPGRGELLPYYYFHKYHFFENAVIIHDSVFFQKRIKFGNINLPVLPLWHFDSAKKENLGNSIRLASVLRYKRDIITKLYEDEKILIWNNNNNWIGCFGCQCYISHQFLSTLNEKYNIFSLLHVVKNRSDRCCLERIFGLLFSLNCHELINNKIFSLLGPILTYMKWEYSFDEYCRDILSNKKINVPLLKVWTGR
jgi:hypothetical protein